VTVLATCLLAALLAVVPGPSAFGATALNASEANGLGSEPAMSSNAYVAFRSAASNLMSGDTNGVDDVFLRNLAGDTTSRISLDTAGGPANGASSSPAISSDGRYIAFRSAASDLVSGDTNGADDIFLRDRGAWTTTRISVDSAGAQANASSYSPSISSDGRYIAFRSSASNLVSGDTNGADDIFVHDRSTGATTRVSVDSAGAQANGPSSSPSISGDGGEVAFRSAASNLVSGDTNGVHDVFVRDRSAGTTTRVSVGSTGQAKAASGSPSISSDGSRVAFESGAGLHGSDDNGTGDVYLYDRVASTVTWASQWADGRSSSPAISGDGRYVAFGSDSPVFVGDVNNARDVFEYDMVRGYLAQLSTDDAGGRGNGPSDAPSLSSDGKQAAFESLASNFTVDTNDVRDVFVHTWVGDPVTARVAWGGVGSSSAAGLTLAADQEAPALCRTAKPKDPTLTDQPTTFGVAIDSQAAPTVPAVFSSASVQPAVTGSERGSWCYVTRASESDRKEEERPLPPPPPPPSNLPRPPRIPPPPHDPNYLFRTGGDTAVNFTPRYPEDTVGYPDNGLTTWTSAKRACDKKLESLIELGRDHNKALRDVRREKVWQLDRGKLATIGGLADPHQDPADDTHYFLRANTETAHIEWAKTSDDPDLNDETQHQLTREIRATIVNHGDPIRCRELLLPSGAV
jgi:Tol biopolymer transport system component